MKNVARTNRFVSIFLIPTLAACSASHDDGGSSPLPAEEDPARVDEASLALESPLAPADECRPYGEADFVAKDAITVACRYVGQLYAWGGGHAEGLPGPSQGTQGIDPASWYDYKIWSFDCIGFVRWAYFRATGQDIITERTAHDTWKTPAFTHQRFTRAQGAAPLRPGDILYFGSEGSITHAALYLGDGKMVEARGSGLEIQVNPVRWEKYQGAIHPMVGGVIILDNYPGEGRMHKSWGKPNLRDNSNTSGVVNYSIRNGISVGVRALCQRVGEKVNVQGMINNVWSYLPDYHSWVSNIFIQGPAILDGVPSCGQYYLIGGTMNGAESNTSCADGSMPSGGNPTSPKTAELFGRKIELRYNPVSACAWGRISNGSVGDEIWVDRSGDDGATWEPRLGLARIESGRDNYTTQWNDNGPKMRACGKAGDRVEIACTDWY